MRENSQQSRILNTHDLVRRVASTLFPRKIERFQQLRHETSTKGYSLTPFDTNSCIFIHIPKTAGVSVCRALFGNLAGGHIPAMTYKIIFSKADFERYFKFTFVRNPWDRVYSAFHFLKHGGFNVEDLTWSQTHLNKFQSFEDFVVHGLTKRDIRKHVHFRPQCYFLQSMITRDIVVDFIGRFENLTEDFNHIKTVLNIDAQLPHSNRSQLPDNNYKNAYSRRAREIVRSVYKKDIDLFGYSFD